jgi:diaminopimelate epimerase
MKPPTLSFQKATACGNDFLIIDGAGVPDLSELTRRICDRHNGVGADGVEWTFSASDADLAVRLFNADGSEAEISGNGTRCVAASWVAKRGTTEVRIQTAAGTKTCTLIDRSGVQFTFQTAMGSPMLGDRLAVRTSRGEFLGLSISMGNPHFVVFCDHFPADWREHAAEMQKAAQFPDGVNVEFALVHSRSELEIRLFERGVGETQSSGTGSCASAVAAISGGYCQSPVHVQAPGGTQTVHWEHEVRLTGPATLVCSGEFFV